MAEHYCQCCKYTTTVKSNFKKHLNSMKHKNNTKIHKNRQISQQKSTIFDTFHKCKYCEKEFTTKQSMYRHIKYTCKNNNDEDFKELARLLNEQLIYQTDQNQKMQSQMFKMQSQIEKLTNKLQMHSVNNGTIINNNVNNIKILNYNKTDYSHLTEQDYVKCIKDCNKCVKTMIEKVHFNKDKPENMNIYISSIKGNYVMMYKDNQWQIANRKETIDDIFDKNEFELESWYDEYKTKHPDMIKSFKRYLKNKEESDIINDVKDEIIMMLYNKRKVVDINIE